MNKNHSKNALYFYKLQFEEMNKGKIFNKGITDTTVAALDSWKTMTLQQREPFEDLAKKAAKPKMAKTNRNALSETNERYYGKLNTVSDIVRHSFLNHTIKTREYHFIAANVFCQTMMNKYYPAELAIIKFTLQDGVAQSFHSYVNPETLPIGYRFDAMFLSNETHQLPIPPNAKGEKNFARVLEEMTMFIGSAQKFVHLFTLEENIPMIESIVQEFCSAAKTNRFCYEILSVNRLLFDLKNEGTFTDGTSRFESIDDATTQLNQDKFMYLTQIACQFHEENDCSKYCCLSAVKRWAYAISENICIDLNISLVAGQHFPIGVDYPLQLPKHNSKPNELEAISHTKLNSKQDINWNDDVDFYNSFHTLDDRLREGRPVLQENFVSLRSNNRGVSRRGSFGRGHFCQKIYRRGRIGQGPPC